MGPTWGPPGADRPHVGPMNFAIRGHLWSSQWCPRHVTGLFFIHKIKTPTKSHVTAAKAHYHVSRAAALVLEIYLFKLLSFTYPSNYANFQYAWGTNQTVDLFKSFNPAWSSEIFCIKLITNSMTGIVVVPCIHLSVPNDVTALTLQWFQLWVWNCVGDAEYHEADRYLKWLCYANFCAFHRTLKFSHHGLKIGGMMQCTMRRITSWNGYAQPNNVRIFRFRPAQGAVVLWTSYVLWKQTKIALSIPWSA